MFHGFSWSYLKKKKILVVRGQIRPLQVTLWFLSTARIIGFLSHLILDFYLIISTTHVQNDPCGQK